MCIYLFEIVNVCVSGFENGSCLFYILIWNCIMFICLFEFLSYVFVYLMYVYVCVTGLAIFVCLNLYINDSIWDMKLYNICLFIWNCICMCISGFDNLCILIWNCIMFVSLKSYIVCWFFEIVYVCMLVVLTIMFSYVCILIWNCAMLICFLNWCICICALKLCVCKWVCL